ncbi:MAG: hypothetical protein JEZ06_08880 [Anaerolineaceae bacterium]|nr:hypothetical protein [Anaerolineaceae bacterium]
MKQIEVEISSDSAFWTMITILFILILVGFAFLGKSVTSETGEILSFQDWQIIQIRKAYMSELERLQAHTETLSGLLNTARDPVRGQVAISQVLNDLEAGGEKSLDVPRAALIQASQLALDWSIGRGSHFNAQASLQEAIDQVFLATDEVDL